MIRIVKLYIYSLQVVNKLCSGVDVEVSDEASEDISVLVRSVHLNLGVVVTEGSE